LGGEGEGVLSEFVSVLRDVRRVLISVSLVRLALIYLLWGAAVCGFSFLLITFRGLGVWGSLITYVSWVYWGVAAVGITVFFVRGVEPRLAWLEKELSGGGGRRRVWREALYFFLAWVASFVVGCDLVPWLISPAGSLGILFSLASGNLSNFLIVLRLYGVSDYPPLLASLILYASCVGAVFISGYRYLFMLSAIMLAYTLAGAAYLIRSIRVLVRREGVGSSAEGGARGS